MFQKHASDLEILKERAEEARKIAGKKSRAEIAKEIETVLQQWKVHNDNFHETKNFLDELSHEWNVS